MKLLKKIFGIGFLFFVLSFFIRSAFAQQTPFDLSTTPQAFDLIAAPGDTIHKIIKVRNNNDSPLTLSISIKKLIPDTGGQINIVDFRNEDYKSWLQVQNASVAATPKEWIDIPFTLTVPKTAAYGYYWAIMLSATSQKSQSNSPQAQLTGAIAIPVLLDVQKPGASFSGQITHFLTNSSFFEYLPVTFLTTFVNHGNVHVKPHGNIFITDMTGQQIATLAINRDLGSILPGGTRTFETSWDDGFITRVPKVVDGKQVTDKSGKVVYELQMHFDKILHLRIGKYTAHALMVVSTDTKDISYEATTTFWVFPWKIVLGLLAVLVLAGVGLIQTGRSIIKFTQKVLGK